MNKEQAFDHLESYLMRRDTGSSLKLMYYHETQTHTIEDETTRVIASGSSLLEAVQKFQDRITEQQPI